jgi:hypothetical protein
LYVPVSQKNINRFLKFCQVWVSIWCKKLTIEETVDGFFDSEKSSHRKSGIFRVCDGTGFLPGPAPLFATPAMVPLDEEQGEHSDPAPSQKERTSLDGGSDNDDETIYPKHPYAR